MPTWKRNALLLALVSILPLRLPAPLFAAPKAPPRIEIVPRPDRTARERPTVDEASRHAALRPEVLLWCRAYLPAARPLGGALREAISSLTLGWGPASHNLGYPIAAGLPPVAALPPVPDPLLARELHRALLYIKEGAEACTRRLPMTSLLLLARGDQDLRTFEASLATYGTPCSAEAEKEAEEGEKPR